MNVRFIIQYKTYDQGGELDIFTDWDQRGSFGAFEFRKSVFLEVLVIGNVFFGL